MKFQFVQDGDSIDFTPTVDMEAGEGVRAGGVFGVTTRPIKANEQGSLRVRGVFELTGNNVDYPTPQGTYIFWDQATQSITTDNSQQKPCIGVAAKDAVIRNSVVTLHVLLMPVTFEPNE